MMHHTIAKDAKWRPVFAGVDLAPLNMKDGKGSFLLRFEAGSVCPMHNHPGGEEIYVVSGKGRLNDLSIGGGDFIHTPPGESHAFTQRPTCSSMSLLRNRWYSRGGTPSSLVLASLEARTEQQCRENSKD